MLPEVKRMQATSEGIAGLLRWRGLGGLGISVVEVVIDEEDGGV